MRHSSLLVLSTSLVVLLFCSVVHGMGIYGDKEPVESLYPYKPGAVNGASFSRYDGRGGVIVHVIGDSLTHVEAAEFYGKSLETLDQETIEKSIIYYKNMQKIPPILVISAQDLPTLQKELLSGGDLRSMLTEFWNSPRELRSVTASDISSERDILWISSGYEPKVFPGLFINPPYDNLELFLQEDEQTEITSQIRMLASLINDRKDFSTLKEIYNLIRALTKNERPPGMPIHVGTASQILTQGTVTGCTAYATAFATLARAKGIPSIIVNSAKYDWIGSGCNLDFVQGHLFVEVFIEEEWYLVDSTSGMLYQDYDRGNWFLPQAYVAFTKSLSVIDTGVTEGSHNLLQRVAFLGKPVSYKDPGYFGVALRDDALARSFTTSVKALSLVKDYLGVTGSYSGEKFSIRANPQSIDFTNISIVGQLPLVATATKEVPASLGEQLYQLEKEAEALLQRIKNLRKQIE